MDIRLPVNFLYIAGKYRNLGCTSYRVTHKTDDRHAWPLQAVFYSTVEALSESQRFLLEVQSGNPQAPNGGRGAGGRAGMNIVIGQWWHIVTTHEPGAMCMTLMTFPLFTMWLYDCPPGIMQGLSHYSKYTV